MSLLSEALKNAEPLNSVVFIHDYVQLTFQELVLSIYGRFSVLGSGDEAVATGEEGFCDAGQCDNLGRGRRSLRHRSAVRCVLA